MHRAAPASGLLAMSRMAFIGSVALILLAGIAGGLLRVGVVLPGAGDTAWLGRAALSHAALMICGFLGTVIGIERAVAVRHRAAFIAPLASAGGGLCLLLGWGDLGAWLGVAAALAFTAVNLVIVRRQLAMHTVMLLLAAAAWLVGCVLFAAGVGRAAPLPWWFTFLVVTIAAERLEMARLLRHDPEVRLMLCAVLAALPAGAAWFAVSPALGGLLYGLALVLLALWLMVFDVARRTVRVPGLSRYMAVCLLGGYAWLAVAGAAWSAMAWGYPLRDVALHALGLGFVVSMVMGHAPVILPAVTRIKVQFSAVFYLPLGLLHLSLLLRLGLGSADSSWRSVGAVLNAASMALFAAVLAAAAVAWQQHHGAPRSREKPA